MRVGRVGWDMQYYQHQVPSSIGEQPDRCGIWLPEDLAETLQTLSIANGGKPINAQRTVTAHSPLTEDLDEEMKLMKEEEDTAAQRNNMVGLTMGYGE